MFTRKVFVSTKLDREFEDFDTAVREEAIYDLHRLIVNFNKFREHTRGSHYFKLANDIAKCPEILAGLLSREMLTEELERRIQEKI